MDSWSFEIIFYKETQRFFCVLKTEGGNLNFNDTSCGDKTLYFFQGLL